MISLISIHRHHHVYKKVRFIAKLESCRVISDKGWTARPQLWRHVSNKFCCNEVQSHAFPGSNGDNDVKFYMMASMMTTDMLIFADFPGVAVALWHCCRSCWGDLLLLLVFLPCWCSCPCHALAMLVPSTPFPAGGGGLSNDLLWIQGDRQLQPEGVWHRGCPA